jgi:hypothetical protein
MDCQNVEAQTIWKKHLLAFVLTLHKNKFPVTFIVAVKRELTVWRIHFAQILRDKNLLRRYSPELWASKLIRATWQFLHDTWEDRCRKLHETDLIHDLSGKRQLILLVKAELQIGLHNLPACDFSRLFSIPSSVLFAKPLEYLKDWFVTVRSARILYNDTSLLQDQFATEPALRRWVGLPIIVDHDSENELSDHD